MNHMSQDVLLDINIVQAEMQAEILRLKKQVVNQQNILNVLLTMGEARGFLKLIKNPQGLIQQVELVAMEGKPSEH